MLSVPFIRTFVFSNSFFSCCFYHFHSFGVVYHLSTHSKRLNAKNEKEKIVLHIAIMAAEIKMNALRAGGRVWERKLTSDAHCTGIVNKLNEKKKSSRLTYILHDFPLLTSRAPFTQSYHFRYEWDCKRKAEKWNNFLFFFLFPLVQLQHLHPHPIQRYSKSFT